MRLSPHKNQFRYYQQSEEKKDEQNSWTTHARTLSSYIYIDMREELVRFSKNENLIKMSLKWFYFAKQLALANRLSLSASSC